MEEFQPPAGSAGTVVAAPRRQPVATVPAARCPRRGEKCLANRGQAWRKTQWWPQPARQRQLMTLVEAVKAGRVESTDYVQLVNILEDLRTQGAEAMVAAYTEISTLARLYTRVAKSSTPPWDWHCRRSDAQEWIHDNQNSQSHGFVLPNP